MNPIHINANDANLLAELLASQSGPITIQVGNQAVQISEAAGEAIRQLVATLQQETAIVGTSDRLITPTEAAFILRVDRSAIDRLIANGALSHESVFSFLEVIALHHRRREAFWKLGQLNEEQGLTEGPLGPEYLAEPEHARSLTRP